MLHFHFKNMTNATFPLFLIMLCMNMIFISMQKVDETNNYYSTSLQSGDIPISGVFVKGVFNENKLLKLNMPFEISYDDMKFHVICIATTGSVSLADSFQNNNKVILYGIPGVTKGLNEVETIVDDSYVAIRWPCLYFIDKNEMELGECAILLMIINRDGTVTYFFEKVPMDFDKSKFHLLIYNGFYHLSPDGVESITIRDKLHSSITPGSQITSGSSYKVMTYPACSHQKTCSTCFTKSHPSQNCIWCPTVSRCEYSQNVDNSRSTEYECSITNYSV
ncbi:Immunogenic miracidial antigen 8I [Schistosoma japonicum]|uniref:Immunogenic miracidial antigen 8I n=1 Tax=Schistosoma japonicum TaxID=6182 RepID=A0A4Z2DLN6_SCHJA|nr:Immunogenic miracidial antigen 8I [Schistosoma japonicum]